jgi:hypothetical protein
MAPPRGGSQLLAATARLALFALGVAMVTSRVGLIAHELLGHGGAAMACDADIREVRLYVTAGGWISYERTAPWTWSEALVVQLAGIAIELAIAAAAAAVAVRRPGVTAVAFGGAALGLALHAGFYLAAGTYHGVGDGALLHRALGGQRLWLALPVAAALIAVAFIGARRLASTVRAWLPARTAAGQLAALLLALAVAGGAHAGLAAAEVAARPSPTYETIMRPARQRDIDRDVATWIDAESARGRTPDVATVRARRRQLERERPEAPFGLLLGIALVVATAAGAALGRPTARNTAENAILPPAAVRWAVTSALIAALSTGAIDALAS